MPCDYTKERDAIKMRRYEKRNVPEPPPTPTSLPALVETLDPWEQYLLRDLEFLVPEQTIWDAVSSHQCIFASDGSAPKTRGSFAWVLSDTGGNRLAQCSGPVFGHKISSYRAEGYGII